jgi:tetratricopeptide (TPR) repeat protein
VPSDHSERPRAELRLSEVVFDQGDFDRAKALVDQAESGARAANDERLVARCELERIKQRTQQAISLTDALAEARESLVVLERLGDEEGVVSALSLIGTLTFWLGSNSDAQVYWRQALERTGTTSPRVVGHVRSWLLLSSAFGLTPVAEAIRLCDETIAETSSKRLEAMALIVRGTSKGHAGQLEEGRREAAEGRALLLELGHRMTWAGTSIIPAEMELLAGSAELADELLSESREVLMASDETGFQSSLLVGRARAALQLGRDDEALRYADAGAELASSDDFEPHVTANLVRAQVLARRGDLEGANEQLVTARGPIEAVDHVALQLGLALASAEVARLAGNEAEERAALERAVSVAEAKGYRAAAERIREQLLKD